MHRVELHWQYVWLVSLMSARPEKAWCYRSTAIGLTWSCFATPTAWGKKKFIVYCSIRIDQVQLKPLGYSQFFLGLLSTRLSSVSEGNRMRHIHIFRLFGPIKFPHQEHVTCKLEIQIGIAKLKSTGGNITTWTFREWSKQSCCQRGKNEAQERR